MHTGLKVAALLAVLAVVGCDKKEDSTSTATPGGTAVTTPPTGAPAAPGDAATNMQTGMQNAVGAAGANSAVATDAAKTKLQQVVDLLKDKKYDAADMALKEVEGMKASLPQGLQDQVSALRVQLNAAKAVNGAGITMPSMPK